MIKIHYIDNAQLKKRIEQDIFEHNIIVMQYETSRIDSYYRNRLAGKLNTKGEVFATPIEIATQLERFIEAHTKKQNEYYSNVKIVEQDNQFLLVYDDIIEGQKISGTGPFSDIESATKWFLNGGR